MNIRRANKTDIDGINSLLSQVLEVHHSGRADLFRSGTRKYDDDELLEIIADDSRPIFVAADEQNRVLGYAFCIFETTEGSHIFTDRRELYIDDLCVDENMRGQHIGGALYEFVKSFARENGCCRITLNVWSCNESAMKFYQRMGLVPYKVGMEEIL